MKDLLAGKPRMLGDVKLTELFVSELPNDVESSGRRSNDQRHGEDRTYHRPASTETVLSGHPIETGGKYSRERTWKLANNDDRHPAV
jgi:hypothetical protein